jgi:hypothetical protein
MDEGPRATAWIAAWNSRDVDAIVGLYAEEIEFASPFVTALGFGMDGVIYGRDVFRAYVEMALPRVPNLHFDTVAVCAGARGHTLIYKNQSGVLVCESHEYDSAGLIIRADAAYEIDPKG